MTVFMFVAWTLGSCGLTPPSPPTDLSCKVDSDCVYASFEGVDCCGTLCGTTKVTTRAHMNAHRAWRESYCPDRPECPVASCPQSAPWEMDVRPACIDGVCQGATSYDGLADKDALAFLCGAMAQDPPEAVVQAAPEDKQRVWMEGLTRQASEAGIARWKELARQLEHVPASEKAPWLQASIEGHGLQDACAVMKATGAASTP